MMRTVMSTVMSTLMSVLRGFIAGVGFLFLLLGAPNAAWASVNLHLTGNLSSGTCDVVLENQVHEQDIELRGVLASEFNTSQTATLTTFQMILTNCESVELGRTYGVSVKGTTLTNYPAIFNDKPDEDLGFMLKENGNDDDNYWRGTKEDFYDESQHTVVNGQETHTGSVTENDPTYIRLNYVVGVVSPKKGVNAVSSAPRSVTASVTFEFVYH